jgi:Fe-S-cluster-containing dehydrogenase component
MPSDKQSSRWRIKVIKGKTGAGKETECVRCMACEVICSFMKERQVNPEMSRIRVVPTELEWIEGESDGIVSHNVCHQCPGITPCMKACPVEGAIFKEPNWGTVLIDNTKCDRCKACIDACPFGSMWFNEEKDEVLKCDLCGGEPACADWCPVGVLKLAEITKGKNNE